MKYRSELALSALLLASAHAGAQDQSPDGSCPLPASAPPVIYSRLHQIPTTASNDDVSHTIVTPGGMVLHSPQMVAARDVLTVIARDEDVICFHLTTLGKERHKCEIGGVARREAQGSYFFHDASVAVGLTFAGEDQVNVAPLGATDRTRCEPLGSIERATYTLNVQTK